ncbi:hypothetical protein [Methylobacterium marchantiae]|uniref:Uncharacterized protein n=1 Tax=Methylobacterium marchantiae TaxID=600331 RepID=A0ABW3WV69_9HYPH|nr:hypothetical protein AIGOOFII_0774 [Methylobacterium marchantiae]
MTDKPRQRPSLKDFDAYTDRNGQNPGQNLDQDGARDVGIPSRAQASLKGDPSGEAKTARIASGTPSEDATDQTEAEVPAENIRAIGDASQKAVPQSEATKDSIDRATASVGKDEES